MINDIIRKFKENGIINYYTISEFVDDRFPKELHFYVSEVNLAVKKRPLCNGVSLYSETAAQKSIAESLERYASLNYNKKSMIQLRRIEKNLYPCVENLIILQRKITEILNFHLKSSQMIVIYIGLGEQMREVVRKFFCHHQVSS